MKDLKEISVYYYILSFSSLKKKKKKRLYILTTIFLQNYIHFQYFWSSTPILKITIGKPIAWKMVGNNTIAKFMTTIVHSHKMHQVFIYNKL